MRAHLDACESGTIDVYSDDKYMSVLGHASTIVRLFTLKALFYMLKNTVFQFLPIWPLENTVFRLINNLFQVKNSVYQILPIRLAIKYIFSEIGNLFLSHRTPFALI